MKMIRRSKKKGFTIVELVIVIAVIGILSAILIPTFVNVTTQAREKAALANCRNEYSQLVLSATEAGGKVDADIVYEHDGFKFKLSDGVLTKGEYNVSLMKKTALPSCDIYAPSGAGVGAAAANYEAAKDLVSFYADDTGANHYVEVTFAAGLTGVTQDNSKLTIYNATGATVYDHALTTEAIARGYAFFSSWTKLGVDGEGSTMEEAYAAGNAMHYEAKPSGYFYYDLKLNETTQSGVFYIA